MQDRFSALPRNDVSELIEPRDRAPKTGPAISISRMYIGTPCFGERHSPNDGDQSRRFRDSRCIRRVLARSSWKSASSVTMAILRMHACAHLLVFISGTTRGAYRRARFIAAANSVRSRCKSIRGRYFMRARVLYGLPETYPGRREYKLLLSRCGIPPGRGRKIMNDGFARPRARTGEIRG